MNVSEILKELPKLSKEERQLVFAKLSELGLEETPEILAAIDEADTTSPDSDLSVEEIRHNVSRWAHQK